MDSDKFNAIKELWILRAQISEYGDYSNKSKERIKNEFTLEGKAKLFAASMIVSDYIYPLEKEATEFICNQIAKDQYIEDLIENDEPYHNFTHLIIVEALQFVPRARLRRRGILNFLRESRKMKLNLDLVNLVLERAL